jgi:acylphosphatase
MQRISIFFFLLLCFPCPCRGLPFALPFFYNLHMKTYHYTISGQVQGVAFRHYTVRAADKWEISGTVSNLDNGDVEVFAQGDEMGIVHFELFLHTGPRSAMVEKVQREIVEQPKVFRGFDISW